MPQCEMIGGKNLFEHILRSMSRSWGLLKKQFLVKFLVENQ